MSASALRSPKARNESPKNSPKNSPRAKPEEEKSTLRRSTTEALLQKEQEAEKIISENMQQLQTAYGCESHVTQKSVQSMSPDAHRRNYIVDYEPLKFSSFRVCCVYRGTILQDPILITEQLLLTALFFAFALPVYWFFKHRPEEMHTPDFMTLKSDMKISDWLEAQEAKMRAFAMIMTTLAAFLLSFYTSITVQRWWTMRTGGVGGIKAACVDLELLLYQNVTQDEEVLSAVRRYGRTSLTLIFLWRRDQLSEMREVLVSRGLLTEHEAEQLLKWNHVLHETIWAWQSGIVTMLYKEGKIKSDQLFQMLLQKCIDGRTAVQCIHTHLAVRVPMQYVHLLGLLVKMHNGILAIIMGMLFGAAWGNRQVIIMVQCFGRTLILPFLFNAILLINAELSDPFDGGEADFPGAIYQDALDHDCKGMIDATKNMPNWLSKRYVTDANMV